MKKITLLITLMISSLGFSQDPLTGPTDPIARKTLDVISIYNGIASPVSPQYTNEPNGDFLTFNGCTIVGPVALNDGNTVMKYTNHLYSGIQAGAGNLDVSAMTKMHIDVYSPGFTAFEVKLEAVNGSNVQLSVPGNHVQGTWNSYDLDLSTYSGVDLAHLKFIVPVTYTGSGQTLYIDNVYFWRDASPEGTPSIGALSVSPKNTGDADFDLTDPISDSLGAFTYTSSDPLVATISGKTVTVVGAGTSIITATQAASGIFIEGKTTANLIVTAVPTEAAPTPPYRNVADVKSIYGDKYTSSTIGRLAYGGNVDSYNTDWCGGVTSEVIISGNAANKITGLGCEGVAFQTNRINATEFTYLHMDIWTASPTLDKSFNLKFSNWNGGSGEDSAIEFSYRNASTPALPNSNPGTWLSLDIPLSSFTIAGGGKLNRNDIVQFIITSDLGIVYYDNVYFYKGTSLGTTSFEKSKLKVYPNPASSTLTIEANSAIERVSIHNVLGQEVLSRSPKTNNTTLDISNLQKGTYIVRTTSEGKTETTKVLKK